jgi:CheY-like chemotaxis protein
MLEKILVVGRQPQAQQLARSFTQRLYAADNAGDIWTLIESSEPDLILFDADIPHDTIHLSLDIFQKKEINIPVVAVCSKDRIQVFPGRLPSVGSYCRKKPGHAENDTYDSHGGFKRL